MDLIYYILISYLILTLLKSRYIKKHEKYTNYESKYNIPIINQDRKVDNLYSKEYFENKYYYPKIDCMYNTCNLQPNNINFFNHN